MLISSPPLIMNELPAVMDMTSDSYVLNPSFVNLTLYSPGSSLSKLYVLLSDETTVFMTEEPWTRLMDYPSELDIPEIFP